MKKKFILFLAVLLLGIFLRFYQLNNIPNGIDIDEASQGYDAYSLLKTGKDRYGGVFPVFMRSFGNYQSPLYTYLTIIPTYFFDLSPFSTRFISALSGVIVLICTFVLILNSKNTNKFKLAIFAALFIAISPWTVLFSRTAVEANLALALFAASVFLFVLALEKKPWLFVSGCMLLALSTYAYHAERLLSALFLGGFIWIFKKSLFNNKRILVLGIILFFAMQIPQLMLINTPASKSRIQQVNYWSNNAFNEKPEILKDIGIGNEIFVVRKFLAQYVSYFSPKNLFFDADEQVIRSTPDLSVFYPWMIIPLIFGIKAFLKHRSNQLVRILFLILVISPIPAAVTREPFYTIRVLPLFWVMTIMISFGTCNILERIKQSNIRHLLTGIFILFSLSLLYKSYFILLKYERMADFGYYNNLLINKFDEFKQNKIIVDSSRMNLGIWYFYQKKYDPEKLQNELSHFVQQGYYSSIEFDEKYKIDNLEIKPINFHTDICKDNIIVGDSLTISEPQAEDHKLKLIFEIKDLNNKVKFKGYSTDPKAKC